MGGIDLIGEGGVTLIDGLGQLSDGADQLAAGSGDLAAGAGQLDSGLGDLAAGAGQLDDGASQLKDGAGKLADGLGDAADGSGKIADGLDKAAGGAPKLQDGAQRLSDEGTKKLIEAGRSTAVDYGQKYALIEAGAKRAKAEGMAYGAPANAAGNTAYSYELAGMSGEGSRNMGRTAGRCGHLRTGRRGGVPASQVRLLGPSAARPSLRTAPGGVALRSRPALVVQASQRKRVTPGGQIG